MRLFDIAACVALLPCIAVASPPPPPPEYIANAAEILTADLTAKDFDAYAAEFADDVHVLMDGRLAASGKASWLTSERARIGRAERRLVGHAEGRDTVLVVDQFDDRSDVPDNPGAVFDPRFVTRAAEYRFGPDHLVHEVRFVQNDGFWISARHGG